MAYAFSEAQALDYASWRHGSSRLTFRGPAPELHGDYVAVLGGTETYGKYVPEPFPALTGRMAGVAVANLGCANAGPDVYINDPGVMEIAGRSRLAVMQIMGAQNLSNRHYIVHPRRNDRFLRASAQLRQMFPEVDFTEFNFTRHMLRTLQAVSPERFERVAEELRQSWVARMKSIMAQLPEVILLWMSDRLPPARGGADLDHEPLLVDAGMIAAIRPFATAMVEVLTPSAGDMIIAGEPGSGLGLPGPDAHHAAAEALTRILRQLL